MNNVIAGSFGNFVLPFLFFLSILVILFLLFRELMLWYWRINENTESLKSIAESLEIISNAVGFPANKRREKMDVANAPEIDNEKISFTEKEI